jgi:hypothetical protein
LERYKAERAFENQASLAALEKERLELERYKAGRDYKRFVLGSVFVALAIAAIPPLFQLASAWLEYVKSSADRQLKQQALHDEYIKEFMNNALNQDIELRIRFAQYFARVSTEPYREDWLAYLKDLSDKRGEIRIQIDKLETQWHSIADAKNRDENEVGRLERNLDWLYKEIGYAERNRSANPRASELIEAEGNTGALLWYHNGSTLRLVSGQGQRQSFIFVEPRSTLRSVGVKPGMAQFDGVRDANTYRGYGYAFSTNCGALSFAMSGEARSENLIMFRGKQATIDPSCQKKSEVEVEWLFSLGKETTDLSRTIGSAP